MEKNIFDISDFLPKYPSVFDEYLNPYPDENFNKSIYHKKEFYDERLDEYEPKPSQKGQLMKHQKIISRFLSSHTKYDSLLLYHYMGTGKGCSAIGTMEKIKKENSSISRAIILARGSNILNNIMNELVFICTDGEYIPDDFEKLPLDTRNSRIKKNIKDFYNFETFYRFANEIKTYSDEYIIKHYSNTIIVIDEAHNLRIKPKKRQEQNIYYQIHRFLHLIQNKKVLLMTGTPMKDRPDEIAGILNLLLPMNKQLPTGSDFVSEYLLEEDGIYVVKSEKRQQLKKYFKGIVSYLKPMKSNTRFEYIGDTVPPLRMFRVFIDEMKKIQNDKYLKTYQTESNKKFDGSDSDEDDDDEVVRSGWFSQSRQASLFVFPDGSIGKKGFSKYIREDKKTKTGLNLKKSVSYTYKLKRFFVESLKGQNIEETLKNISKYSSKYAIVIRQILDAKDKSCFVYCSFVKGSGAILFSLLLELCGFSKANGGETKKGLKYGLLSSSEGSKINKIIGRFNNNDNLYGQYIRVLIGSRIVGEGLSFFNVQQVHILTAHWNFSETEQAITRSIRAFSHAELTKRNRHVEVDIYLHTSIPEKNNKLLLEDSIDLNMYVKSEYKDVSIKNIERLLKESAIDCALNYTRNSQYTDDYSRDCEYLPCEYTCNGVTNLEITNDEIDSSTYDLYYIQDNMKKIQKEIQTLYKTQFIYTFYYISKNIKYKPLEILITLKEIINKNIVIYNKYGFPNYLREESNSYFLVNDLTVMSNYLNTFYSQIPNLKVDINFKDIVNKQYYSHYIPYLLQTLKMDERYRTDTIQKFDIDIQEMILENSIKAKNSGISQTNELQDWVISYYNNFIQEIDNDNIVISKLLLPVLRCFSKINNTWYNCPDNISEQIGKNLEQNISYLENNQYGYYGIITKKGDFLIRNVSSEKAKKAVAKSSRTKGKNCKSWERKDLLFLIFKFKIIHKNKVYNKKSGYNRNQQIDLIENDNKFKHAKKMIEENNFQLTNIIQEDLDNIFYFGTNNKDILCSYIRDFFEKGQLVLYE